MPVRHTKASNAVATRVQAPVRWQVEPSAPPAIDQRKAGRLALHLKVHYTLLLPGRLLRGESVTTNLSGTGVQFLIPRIVSPQTVCQINLSLPDREEPLAFLGRVAWCAQASGKRRDRYDVGIALSAFDSYHEGAFAQYCFFLADQLLAKYLG